MDCHTNISQSPYFSTLHDDFTKADDTNDDHNCWGCIDTFATATSVDGDANTTIDNIVDEVFAAIKAGVIEADTVNFKDHSLLRQLWFP